MPSKATVGLFGVIAAGITLIGATTYIVATRYYRRKRAGEDACDDDLDALSDDDDLNFRLSTDRKRRGLQRKGLGAERPPPLITFSELFEQALLMEQQSMMRRNVKIYFDSNDEYVREEQMPELMQSSARTVCSNDGSFYDIDDGDYQRILETIAFKYNCVNVFFGNEDV